MSAPAPALPADLETALRRLRLAAIRKLAPELLVVAKTQRWSPELVTKPCRPGQAAFLIGG